MNKDEYTVPILMFLGMIIMLMLAYYIEVDEQERNKIVCPPCEIQKAQQEADKQYYLKLAWATKKYCSANWFDGSEVCQHLETECFNYCIKTSEKNCRVECESRI